MVRHPTRNQKGPSKVLRQTSSKRDTGRRPRLSLQRIRRMLDMERKNIRADKRKNKGKGDSMVAWSSLGRTSRDSKNTRTYNSGILVAEYEKRHRKIRQSMPPMSNKQT